MNQNFCDLQKKVFIKILDAPKKIEREIIGSTIFSSFVSIPKIEFLDSRTLKISFAQGIKSDLIEEEMLNNLIIDLLSEIKKNFRGTIIKDLTINQEIESLRKIIKKPKIIAAIKFIEKNLINQNLYPTHGDLQKQNIFIDKSKLVLIDFEHFLFAPLELELVNSLFFNDENCLNVKRIIPALCDKGIISPNLLGPMLIFYAIKQFTCGKPLKKVKNNLESGLNRLALICNFDKKFLPKFLNMI